MNTLESSRICSNSFDYPIYVRFATGGLLNTTSVICGGEDDEDMVTDKCYAYGFKAKQSRGWKNIVNMSEPRSFSSSIVIEDMIWITGGYNNNQTLTSTEQIFLNKTVREGPKLEEPKESHCMASHENKIFIIGGSKSHPHDSAPLNQVQMYNGDDLFEIPINVSAMAYNRKNHACTIFQSQIHGGGDSKEASTTAEILDFLVGPDGTQTIWQPGNIKVI